MPTLEEAKRCPKCEVPGELRSSHTTGFGKKVHVFNCQNERCKWYGTGYVVQVNEDGSIPERKQGPKQFEQLDTNATRYAEAVLEKSKEELMRGEVNPNG